jgi:hypothetical protein
MEMEEKINADKLAELWDSGFENDNLDPGDIFDKTLNYCYKLEAKLNSDKQENLIDEKFINWIYPSYSKYWGSDGPNCGKWYKNSTMPDRKYYTLKELYDVYTSELKIINDDGTH